MKPQVNNSFYNELGSRWYQDDSHAIALLKAESKQKLKYVREFLPKDSKILDVGCGAGFIANPLSRDGHTVKGIDLSENSLLVAKKYSSGSLAQFEAQNAYSLKEKDASFDIVLLLDVLEHVENPKQVISEANRVLKPGGLLFFHTFNRTPLSRYLAIKGIGFVTRDCPEHVHVYHLFLKPDELCELGAAFGLTISDMRGIRPRIFHTPFFWSLLHRRVHPRFEFVFTHSLSVGYLGCFKKAELIS